MQLLSQARVPKGLSPRGLRSFAVMTETTRLELLALCGLEASLLLGKWGSLGSRPGFSVAGDYGFAEGESSAAPCFFAAFWGWAGNWSPSGQRHKSIDHFQCHPYDSRVEAGITPPPICWEAMRKVIRWACVSLTVLVAIAASSVWMLYQAARQEPKFYQTALRIEPKRQVEASDEFEHQVLELHNDARAYGEWSAEFTADQINAWLAKDLPEKFPDALPSGLEEPRVALEDGMIRVAARYADKKFAAVFSFALDIELTDEPNVLAVRVRDVRAGALPIPLQVWLDKVEKRFLRNDMRIRWTQTDGDPVGILEIPVHDPEHPEQSFLVESLTIESGSLYLEGRTGTAESLGMVPASGSYVQRVSIGVSAKNRTTHR